MTSAAIPAFHAIPIQDDIAARKYGLTDGIYSFLITVVFFILKARVIIMRFLSVFFIPDRRLLQTTVSTMSIEVNTGIPFMFIQTMARIINEATGVAFITAIRGAVNAENHFENEQSTASIVPAAIPSMIPDAIRPKEKATDL